jgi:hypothetical protein
MTAKRIPLEASQLSDRMLVCGMKAGQNGCPRSAKDAKKLAGLMPTRTVQALM